MTRMWNMILTQSTRNRHLEKRVWLKEKIAHIANNVKRQEKEVNIK